MQIEGTKLIFIMNFSVLDFFKFASRMPQIRGWGGGGGGVLLSLVVCFFYCWFVLRMHHQSIKTNKCQRAIFLIYIFKEQCVNSHFQ